MKGESAKETLIDLIRNIQRPEERDALTQIQAKLQIYSNAGSVDYHLRMRCSTRQSSQDVIYSFTRAEHIDPTAADAVFEAICHRLAAFYRISPQIIFGSSPGRTGEAAGKLAAFFRSAKNTQAPVMSFWLTSRMEEEVPVLASSWTEGETLLVGDSVLLD